MHPKPGYAPLIFTAPPDCLLHRTHASLDSLVLKIHRAGLQIACHSNGDREIENVCP